MQYLIKKMMRLRSFITEKPIRLKSLIMIMIEMMEMMEMMGLLKFLLMLNQTL